MGHDSATHDDRAAWQKWGQHLVDSHTVSFIYGVLAVVGILILAWFGMMFVASRFSVGIAESFENVRLRLTPYAIVGAFIVAALAMGGSLYFSEVAHFPPCLLCWYQRIGMYPLTVILLIAAFRRDVGVRWYAIPLALIGAAISVYHNVIQWYPELDAVACVEGIPCTAYWFREFGFISMPFLALVAFLLIVTFLLIPMRRTETIDRSADRDSQPYPPGT
jgi:disulfide bond formation protein DsbB